MKEIILSQGKVALVDDEDFDRVSVHKWFVNRIGNTNYVSRNLSRGKTQTLHRFLCPGIRLVDHKDGNGLNNQKFNLRPANRSQNGANSVKQSGRSSKFKGVTWDKRCGLWQAGIMVSYKRLHLGRYESEEDAAHVYDYAAKIYFGEFARPNFL